MKKINRSLLIFSLGAVTSLFSLPQSPKTVSGKASFNEVSPKELHIEASDKTIINYGAFDIAESEKVNFIQPSTKATVLNRVIGDKGSEILGQLSSNGKVFLVNQNGIYFGPKATVNIGSLVVSTLDIKDQDFLNDKYEFTLSDKARKSSIQNFGKITSSIEGDIVLLSPQIRNEGIISTKVGKICLGSGEKAYLDFSGDGLIKFLVEGEVEDALIEQYGSLKALQGDVLVRLNLANKVIENLLNTEGLVEGTTIVKKNGVVRIAADSEIAAEKVDIQAENIDLLGGKITSKDHLAIEASDTLKVRDSQEASLVLHSAKDLGLEADKIDILALSNPETLIESGDDLLLISPNAISADAILHSDGDLLMIKPDGSAADFISLYDPIFSANKSVTFGAYTGVALKVEAKRNIYVNGAVNITGPDATVNPLDPDSGFLILEAAFILRAGNNPLDGYGLAIPPSRAAGGATFANDNSNGSDIFLNGSTITTAGGTIILDAPTDIILQQNTTITSNGGNVTLSNANGAFDLNITAGAGTVTVSDPIGDATALTNLTVSGSTISVNDIGTGAANGVTGNTQLTATTDITFTGTDYRAGTPTYTAANNFYMNGGAATSFVTAAVPLSFLNGTIRLANNSDLSITTAGGNIQTATIRGTSVENVTLNAGAGNVSVGAMGAALGEFGTVALTGNTLTTTGTIYTNTLTLTPGGASTIYLGGGIYTNNTPIAFTRPVIRNNTNNATLSSAGSNISFSDVLDGDVAGRNLTIDAGAGQVALVGVVGGVQPLATLNVTGSTINLTGDITTANGNISLTGSINLLTNPYQLDTGAGTGNIIINGTVQNPVAVDLTLIAGDVSITGAVGGGTRLNSFTIPSAHDVGVAAISAGFINLPNIANTGTFNGALDTNQVGGITLHGLNFVLNGPVNTTAGGPFNVTHTGSLTINSAADMTLHGLFVENDGGTGTVNLNANITTSNDTITFNGPITTTDHVIISNGGGAAAITFNNNISAVPAGVYDFEINAGTGPVNINGTVGSIPCVGTCPRNLNITADTVTVTGYVSAANHTINAVTSASFQALNAFGPTGITINSGTVSIGGDVTTSNGNTVTLNNSGLLTVAPGTSMTLSGPFQQTGAGAVSLGASIVATNADISFASAVTLTDTISLSTENGAGNITFSSTLDSDGPSPLHRNLTLLSGTGNMTFTGAVGATVPIGAFQIDNANVVSVSSNIFADTITQLAGTGTTTFSGTVNTTLAGGVNVEGNNFAFNNTVITAGTGPVTIDNAGSLAILGGANVSSDSAFSQLGAGSVTLAANITTTNDSIQFTGAVNLTGPVIFNNGGSGDVTFSNTLDGSNDLTITAGTGNILFINTVGSNNRLGNLVINSANSLSANSSITAKTINQVATNGATVFSGALDTDGVGGISLNGFGYTFSGPITTTNANPTSLSINHTLPVTFNIPANMTLNAPFVEAGAGGINLGADITTTDLVSAINLVTFNNPITLLDDVSISNSGGVGHLVFNNTIDGTTAEAENLTLTAGGGNITFAPGADVGATIRLGDFQIVSANNVGAQAITASSLTQTAGTGTTTFNSNVTTTQAAGISLTGSNFSFTSPVTTGNSGALTINNSNTLTLAAAADMNLDGAFSQTGIPLGAGIVSTGADITTANHNISFDSVTTLTGNVILTTGAGVGDISFTSTLDATNTGADTLTLAAGGGNIVFTGNVGKPLPGILLGTLTILNANDVTANAIYTSNIIQSAGTGKTTFNGSLYTNVAAGVNLQGNNFIFNGTTTTAAGGGVIVNNTGNLTVANPMALDGPFDHQGANFLYLYSSITTTNDLIQTNGNVMLMAPSALNSGAGPGAGNIVFLKTINGTNDLALTASDGDITVTGAAGSLMPLGNVTINSVNNFSAKNFIAASLTQVAGTGTSTFNNQLTTNGAGGINLTGANFTFTETVTTTNAGPCSISHTGPLSIPTGANFALDGSFTQSGGGTVSIGDNIVTNNSLISFANPVTLTANSLFDSGAGAGNITFSSTVDGTFNFILNAGTGNINLNGNLGAGTALANFQINDANVATVSGTINASSVTQLAGSSPTSLTTFNQTLNTTGTSGISLTGNGFTFNQAVSTSGGGHFSVVNIGALSFAAAGDLTIDGTFTQSGGGSVSTAGDITISNITPHDITFTDPVTLTGIVNLNTSAGNGNVRLIGTVNGGFCLNINAGTGDVRFDSAIGSGTPLGCMNVTAADEIDQNSSLVTATTVNYVGSTLFLGGDVTTTNSNVTINATSIRDNTNNVTINTGVGIGDIAITGNIDGDIAGRNLTLTAGTGDATINGNIGTTNPLNNLTITANDINLNGTIGDGGTGVSGVTSLTATNDINFAGTTYKAETPTFTAGNSFNINTGGGSCTFLTNGTAVLFSGANIQLDGATDFIVTTNGGNLNFPNLFSPVAQDVTINVGNAILTFTDIGTVGQPLNNVVVTYNAINYNAINAASVVHNNISPLLISTDQTHVGAYTYNGPVVISGNNVTITAGGDLTFGSTIDADAEVNLRNLTLQTSTPSPYSDITFQGTVGGAARLDSITIQNVNDVTVQQNLNVGTLTQVNGTGITTFDSILNTNAAGGINLTGTDFTFNNSVTTTNSGPLSVTNSGSLIFTSGISLNLDGPLTQTGTGTVSLGANTVTTNDAVSFSGNVTLTNSTSVDTVAGAGDITFSGTVNAQAAGVQSLSLNAGTGNILFGQTVGAGAKLNHFTINSAQNATVTGSIHTNTISQLAGTGTTAFNSTVTTDGAAGVNLTGSGFAFGGAVTTNNDGPVSINNSAVLTIAAAADMTIDNGFSQTGTGSVNTAGDITTNNQPISFASAVNITGPVALDNSGSGNITFSNTLNGPSDLAITANSWDLLFSSAVGAITPLGNLTINSANTLTANSSLIAQSINQVAPGSATVFNGALSATAGGITLNGSSYNFGGAVSTTGGNFSLNHSGAVTVPSTANMNIDGSFTETGAGIVHLNADIITTGGAVTFNNDIEATDHVAISNSSGASDLTFQNISALPAGTYDFILTAGTGDVIINGTVGSIPCLGTCPRNFEITSARNITTNYISAANHVIGNALLPISGTINFGALNAFGPSGITINGNVVNLNGAVTTVNGNTVTVNNSGLLTIAAVADMTLTGPFQQTGAGNVKTSADINTTNANISFVSQVTLEDNVSFSTQGGIGGNITFNSPVIRDGTACDLTLQAGTGDILFSGAVGASGTELNKISITDARNVTAQKPIHAATITQIAGSGITAFNDTINTIGAGGINLEGTNFSFNGLVTTTNTGPFTVHNSGSLNLGADFNLDGAFAQTEGGIVNLSANITTTNDPISFTGGVNVTDHSQLDTGAAAGNVTFDNTLDGPSDLTIAAGTGDITLVGAAGNATRLGNFQITSANSLTVNNAIKATSLKQTNPPSLPTPGATIFGGLIDMTGDIILYGNTYQFNGPITTTNNGVFTLNHTGNVTFANAANLNLDGAFTETGAGTITLGANIATTNDDISFANPIILTQSVNMSSVTGAGNLSFASTIDATNPQVQDLTLTAGTGDITLTGAVGGIARLGTLHIVSANDVNANLINVGSLSQNAGTGTTTFNGTINTDEALGLNVTGNNFTFNQTTTTTNSGPVIIDNTGTLTLAAAADMTLDGPFNQTGSGNVVTGADITTQNQHISFTGPVRITGTKTLITGLGVGDITFSSTVNGTTSGLEDLILSVGGGNVNIIGNVGQTTRLGKVRVTGALTVTTNAITADTIEQATGIISTTFNGALNTNGIGGINLIGHDYFFNAPVTTTNAGPVSINASGDVTISPAAIMNLDGPFTQIGDFFVYLMSDITTTNDNISIDGNVMLMGDSVLNTGTGAGDVTFNKTIQGGNDLLIDAGSGNVSVAGAIGSLMPLNNLTMNSANQVTVNNIGGGIVQGVQQILTINATDSINFTGSFYQAGQHNYTAVNNFNYNSAPQAQFPITLKSLGSVRYNTGTIQLASNANFNVETTNGAFSFPALVANSQENLIVNTGSATSTIGAVSNAGDILVNAGHIYLAGPMTAVDVDMESLTSVMNATTPFAIATSADALFNALNGNVGTLANAILVNASGQIIAGAGPTMASVFFNGSSVDNTVNKLASNPPCIGYFNGVKIFDCTSPPVPPEPSVITPIIPTIYVPGFYSTRYYNLATYPFFYIEKIFEKTVLAKDKNLYWMK